MLKLLKELTAASGVSGFEAPVRSLIAEKCRPYADEMSVDTMGNLIVFKRGKKHNAPKLMIAAHMDEVGFLINKIEDSGVLRFAEVGGVNPRVALGRRVLIGPDKVPGVTGLKAYHLVSKEEEKKTPAVSQMYIDIGAQNKEEAEKKVKIGDWVVFDSDFVRFGEGKKRIKAKAIDDRIGCAQMIKLMEKDLPMDVTFAFTVQEEVGLRGAKTAAFNVEPDIALILEGTTSADMPGVDDAKKVTRVGGGCVIGCVDTGTIYDRRLFDFLRNAADEAGIPWQIKNYIAGGTDAAVVQRSRAAVRVANISTPVRMLHAASTVADKDDMENGLKLAELLIDAIAAGKVK
ncbi:MAG: M42 family metallopeptidase [Firmicutes bacterium]|nr:M42 family metallopeptidase [Bacillota bacterium]